MEVDFTRNFLKKLVNLKNDELLQKIQESIEEISNLKKLSGHKVYYRIKIGDYRVEIEKIENQMKFLTFLHRKDIEVV